MIQIQPMLCVLSQLALSLTIRGTGVIEYVIAYRA